MCTIRVGDQWAHSAKDLCSLSLLSLSPGESKMSQWNGFIFAIPSAIHVLMLVQYIATKKTFLCTFAYNPFFTC
jgi:hypothetical protein